MQVLLLQGDRVRTGLLLRHAGTWRSLCTIGRNFHTEPKVQADDRIALQELGDYQHISEKATLKTIRIVIGIF